MTGFIENIEAATLENTNFRKVLYTAANLQLVVMSLLAWEEIGEEVHETEDQFIRIEKGNARVILDGAESILTDDMVVIIPAGTKHNIINTSQTDELKLYTIYGPKHHPDGTIHETKAEADAAEHE